MIKDQMGDWNTGGDSDLKVIAPNGENIDLTNMKSFKPKPNTNEIKWDDHKGIPRNAVTPKGWTATFDVVRGTSQIDDMWNDIENDWHDRRIYRTGTVFQFINNADGSQSVFKFEDCAFTLEDAGEWAGDKEVTYTVKFDAKRRVKVR